MIESIVYGLNLLWDESISNNLSSEFIDTLLTRAENNTPVPFDDSYDSLSYFYELEETDTKEIEIYGLFEDFCVASGVAIALESGINARVPKRFTAPYNDYAPSLRDIVASNLPERIFGYNEDDDYHYFVAPPK